MTRLSAAVAGNEELMPSDCQVTVTTERPLAWSKYLARRPDATLFHDGRWGQIMATVYQAEPYYLTAFSDGRATGALQLVLQRSRLFGTHLCGLPYLDAVDLLADDAAARAGLLAAAENLRRETRADWVELRQQVSLNDPSGAADATAAQSDPSPIPARTDKVKMLLALPQSHEELWDALKDKVRNQVRKAEKAGLTALSGGAELLDEFYAVYVRNMRDLGSPPHDREFFRLLVEAYPGAARLYAVRRGDEPLAASLTITDRTRGYVPWAGSDWRRRELCANMLLYWTMLAAAADQGCSQFDFGRSTVESGTQQFKRQWGAQPSPLYWHYLLPAGQPLPDLKPDSPKFRLLVKLWQKLPVTLVRKLGPRIIGKLS